MMIFKIGDKVKVTSLPTECLDGEAKQLLGTYLESQQFLKISDRTESGVEVEIVDGEIFHFIKFSHEEASQHLRKD